MGLIESPKITDLSWGRMAVEGVGIGKDFKLWPGGGKKWDWRETDLCHRPGIRFSDVRELLDHGCLTVVLSQGMLQRLNTGHDTLEQLQRRGIRVHMAETREAVGIYNELAAAGEPVGGLFHSTC